MILKNKFIVTLALSIFLVNCSTNSTNTTKQTSTSSTKKDRNQVYKDFKLNPGVKVPNKLDVKDLSKKENLVINTNSPSEVKGIVIVYVDSDNELDEVLKITNGDLIGGIEEIGLAEIKIPDDKDPSDMAEMLLDQGFNAHPNTVKSLDNRVKSFSTKATTKDPSWDDEKNNWWLKQMNVPEAWDIQEPTAVKVGVIEFGADKHTDINFKQNTENVRKGKGELDHANHVMGIINGVSDNGVGITGVMKGKADLTFYPIAGDDLSTIEAIKKAADEGNRIINMSYGATYSDPIKDEDMGKQSADSIATIMPAIEYAKSKNVLIFLSAGNGINKKDASGQEVFSRAIDTKFDSYSAVALQQDNVMCVANHNKDFNKSESSNFGAAVNISAPGEDIWSTGSNGEYMMMTGTSMSSPAAAGVAALVLSKYPNLTYAQLKESIVNSATKKVNTYNFPAINAKEALEYAKKFSK